MLEAAVADGITHIICTPHITPGLIQFPLETFHHNYQQALDYITAQNLPLRLSAGAEILYTDSTPRLLREGKIPTLAGTRYVMIEFTPADTRAQINDALRKVSSTGFIPVIAHLERYPALSRTSQVKDLKDRFRALVQINARSLLRKQPLFRRGYFDGLFREGLVDFIATDTHSFPGRETCMTEGAKALREKYSENTADRILSNPVSILHP